MADVNQLFADAVARHQSGDSAVAEQMYRSVIAAAPNHASAYCNLGALLGKSGRDDEAAQCYREALRSAPNQSRNSATLTKPIFFMRLRCAEANTLATTS